MSHRETARGADRPVEGPGSDSAPHYSPPGVDDGSGRVGPAPRVGFLTRLVGVVFVVEAVCLIGLTLTALVISLVEGTPGRPTTVLGMHIGPWHGALLAGTGVVLLAALPRVRWMKLASAAQLGGYLFVFLAGVGTRTTQDGPLAVAARHLSGPDFLLHGTLMVLGLVCLMLSAADYLDPPPSPPAYPVDGVGGQVEDGARRAGSAV